MEYSYIDIDQPEIFCSKNYMSNTDLEQKLRNDKLYLSENEQKVKDDLKRINDLRTEEELKSKDSIHSFASYTEIFDSVEEEVKVEKVFAFIIYYNHVHREVSAIIYRNLRDSLSFLTSLDNTINHPSVVELLEEQCPFFERPKLCVLALDVGVTTTLPIAIDSVELSSRLGFAYIINANQKLLSVGNFNLNYDEKGKIYFSKKDEQMDQSSSSFD